MKSSLYILTVLGKDRPGIIALITRSLFKTGANLEDVTMTVLEGELAMMLVVALPDKLQRKTAAHLLRIKSGLTFSWTQLQGRRKRGEYHPRNSTSYLITAMGKDKTGIVYRISQALAGLNVNITDLQSRIMGSGARAVYSLILEADAPKKLSLKLLQKTLSSVNRQLDIEINVKFLDRLHL